MPRISSSTSSRIVAIWPGVRASAFSRSNGSVWTDGGCNAYYTDDDGRNYAIYPGFAAEFRRRTRRFDPEAYELAA